MLREPCEGTSRAGVPEHRQPGQSKCVESSRVAQACLDRRLTPRLTEAGGLREGPQADRGIARRVFLKADSEDYNHTYFVM